MKVNTILLTVFVGAILGSVVPEPEINSSALISESGFNSEGLQELNANVDYSKEKVDVKDEDDEKASAFVEILKPEILGPLLLHGKNFDYKKLGISTKYYFAIKNIFLPRVKSKIIKTVKGKLKEIRKGKSNAEIKSGYRSIIDALAQYSPQQLQDKVFKEVLDKIGDKKEYLKNGPILITYFSDLFEGEVLKVVDEFFSECNEYNPNLARILRDIVLKIQLNFEIFPKGYFNLLKSALH